MSVTAVRGDGGTIPILTLPLVLELSGVLSLEPVVEGEEKYDIVWECGRVVMDGRGEGVGVSFFWDA